MQYQTQAHHVNACAQRIVRRVAGLSAFLVGTGIWTTPTARAQASSPVSEQLKPLDVPAFHHLVASLRDTVVLVDFWATWCAPCREELPGFVALERKLAPRGFRLLIVSVDDSADARAAGQFLDSIQAPQPRYIRKTARDAEFIDAIDTEWNGALPALFIYDRSGKRVARFVGETPEKTVAASIEPLLRK